MNENLPRTLSFFLMAIGVLVCAVSQALEYDFEYSNTLRWYYNMTLLRFILFLSLFIMGAAIVMIGIMLALWSSDRREKTAEETYDKNDNETKQPQQ